jgi:hypothetical protein
MHMTQHIVKRVSLIFLIPDTKKGPARRRAGPSRAV